MIKQKAYFVIIFLLLFFVSNLSFAEVFSEIQLANLYHKGVNLNQYLVSEKLDGVRAYWNGKELISKQGNIIKAPKWFIKDFPREYFEGELWIDRGKFELVSGIVRQEIPNDEEWQKVKLMLFDMPKNSKIFEERLSDMKILVKNLNLKNLKIIEQFEIANHNDLIKKLNEVIKIGGEGLMLHKKDSFYKPERNNDLLKLKTYEDEEAVVISHIAGKGKFEGMLGAILVENKDKIRFKIGGGFSDEQRKNPPKVGSVITYKFYGKTKNNKPRFASFLRVREEI
ncbi:MAG: DNA ligase [Rickettsiales bacterium]|nr:DNA ligase [Rickettsiales bacterium]